MSDVGLILLFIILIPALAIVFCRPFLIKLDTKYKWILILFSLACFTYFIGVRYIPDAIDFVKYKDSISEQTRDTYYSKILLLDLCPFVAFTLPLITIFDKNRKIARLIAPVTIIGSLVTLFGQCIWIQPGVDDLLSINNNIWTYIFVGSDYNRLYFMMHLLSLFLALWVLMVAPTFTWKTCAYNFVSLAVWLIYTVIMMNIFKVNWNVTGLSANDWLYGQYNKMYDFWQLPFPWITIFWYIVAVIINYLIILAIPNNFVQFKTFITKQARIRQKPQI